ncbi:hypothetical protein O3Q51_14275 [Cryomorphaceae bacterium 1068]|nr:hypothetical protein [Cryomorphaceae bacterium 1068]
MKLSEEQIIFIRKTLMDEGIQNESLTDDVLDHICCVVEVLLKRGKNFDEALNEAIDDLAPNGLIDLEIQTRYLLNSKRTITMKKLMYLIGFLGAATLSSGMIFKLMHWPGANVMSVVGLVALVFVFVPLLALDFYRYEVSKALSSRFSFFSGVIATVLIAVSIVFKMLHLQGASVLLVVGGFIFVFAFLPFLFFSLYKKSVS